MNFKELTEEVYTQYYEDGNSSKIVSSTIKELLTIVKPNTNINKIDHKTIQNLIKVFRQNKNSNATINRKLAVMSKCLTHAYNVRYINHKPLINSLPVDNEKLRYLSDDEEEIIIQYFKDNYPILADIVTVCLYTGMRISEVLSIDEDSIESNYIRLSHTKNKQVRSVPMKDNVKEIINRYMPKLPGDSDGLFNNITYTIMYNNWNKMIQSTGLSEDLSIHTLRHTFCSRLVQRGVDLYKVQKLAGHKNIAITQRYAHLRDEDLEAAIQVL